jgi:hypothetical protein
MIEDLELKKLFTIEKERLYNYYQRIQNHFKEFTNIQVIAKFLNSQSIGASINDLMDILNYFEDKLSHGKELIELAFEWIRAQKVRIYYLRYLASTEFPNYAIAIDACIFLFFLKYDNFIRELFKKDIKEYEISTLYNVFFYHEDLKNINFNKLLEEHRNKVPTIFYENKRLDINIFTLRSGIEQVIKKDYEKINIVK